MNRVAKRLTIGACVLVFGTCAGGVLWPAWIRDRCGTASLKERTWLRLTYEAVREYAQKEQTPPATIVTLIQNGSVSTDLIDYWPCQRIDVENAIDSASAGPLPRWERFGDYVFLLDAHAIDSTPSDLVVGFVLPTFKWSRGANVLFADGGTTYYDIGAHPELLESCLEAAERTGALPPPDDFLDFCKNGWQPD